jgi:hypothetical protein
MDTSLNLYWSIRAVAFHRPAQSVEASTSGPTAGGDRHILRWEVVSLTDFADDAADIDAGFSVAEATDGSTSVTPLGQESQE